MNAAEREICVRRGHTPVYTEGWVECGWCGVWLRETRTVEESEHAPQDGPDPLPGPGSQTEGVSPNRAELEICRRRGHRGFVKARWTKCGWCGFWVRATVTREEREDEPPREELSLETESAGRSKSCGRS